MGPLVLVALGASCGSSGSSTPATAPANVSRAALDGPTHPTCTPGPWTVRTVDSRENAGLDPSLTTDDSGGVHVSYHDFANRALAYAYRAGDGSWTRATLDAEGSVGTGSSIAVDDSGGVYVSYYDYTNRALKLASRPADGEWTTEVVDADGNAGAESDLSVGDAIHVAYYAATPGEADQVRYASRQPNGEWSVETVDSDIEDASRNPPPHLVVDGEGRVHIIYLGSRRDAEPRLRPIRHVHRSPGESWHREEVDLVSSTTTGFEPFAAIDSAGGLHVTYHLHGTFDRSRGFRSLHYAHRPAGGRWTARALSWPGHVGGEVPIVVDADMRLHLLYLAVGGAADELEYASGTLDAGWQRSTVAQASHVGARLALDPSGGAHVIFRDRGQVSYAHRAGCVVEP